MKMDIRCNTVLLFIVSTITILACPPGVQACCCCPPFWTSFGRNCYRFFGYENTWSDAEMFCRNNVPSVGYGQTVGDSHLVSIHSQDEQDFVNTLFETSRKKEGANNDRLWLGLHDSSTEGHFEWSDGSPLDFTSWAPTQGNDDNYDCVVIRSNTIPGQWRIGTCVKPPNRLVHYFICKLSLY